MLQIFKYIDYARNAKQGYEKPEELISDTSFGFIENFFIASFILLILGSGGFLFVGFHYGFLLLKVLGFIVLTFLVVDVALYFFVKRLIKNMSYKVSNSVKKNFRKKHTIKVDAHEVKS